MSLKNEVSIENISFIVQALTVPISLSIIIKKLIF